MRKEKSLCKKLGGLFIDMNLINKLTKEFEPLITKVEKVKESISSLEGCKKLKVEELKKEYDCLLNTLDARLKKLDDLKLTYVKDYIGEYVSNNFHFPKESLPFFEKKIPLDCRRDITAIASLVASDSYYDVARDVYRELMSGGIKKEMALIETAKVMKKINTPLDCIVAVFHYRFFNPIISLKSYEEALSEIEKILLKSKIAQKHTIRKALKSYMGDHCY